MSDDNNNILEIKKINFNIISNESISNQNISLGDLKKKNE